jgi:hypothetical protein
VNAKRMLSADSDVWKPGWHGKLAGIRCPSYSYFLSFTVQPHMCAKELSVNKFMPCITPDMNACPFEGMTAAAAHVCCFLSSAQRCSLSSAQRCSLMCD